MNKKLRRIVLGLLRMSIGAATGYAAIMPLALAVKSNHRWILNSAPIFFGLILGVLIGGFILSVALHELGHVVAGKVAGFRFVFMLFWPVQITRKGENGLRVKLRFRTGLGLGGMAGMVPKDGLDLRKAYLTLLAGGPLASLLVSVVTGAIAISLGLGKSLPGSIFWIIGLTSLLLFFLTIVPSNAGGYLSDGAAIMLLKSGKPEAVGRYIALLEMASALATGKRPAEFDKGRLQTLLKADPTEPIFFQARHLSFLHAADNGDLLAARRFSNEIQQHLEKSPVLFRPKYNLDSAWLFAREGEPEKARKLLEQNNGGLVEPCELRLIEAEIALAEGKTDDARRLAHETIALIDQSMIPNAHAFTKHRIQEMTN